MSVKKHKKNPQVPKRRFSKKLVIGICGGIAAVLTAFGAFFGWRAWHEAQPLMTVAGFEISQEEYRWAMYAARDDVLSEHSANGISPIRWGEETALGMPYEMVARRAVEILREYYAVGTLAVERGYLEDAGYDAMVRQLEANNQERSKAIASGQVITGLSSFELEQYISYRASGLRRQFCDDETNPEMALTEEDVRRRYEEDKADLYNMEDSVQLSYIEISDGNLQAEEVSSLEQEVRQLRMAAVECGSLKEAVSQMPRLLEYFREMTMEGESYASYARTYGDLLALSEELDSGEVSEVISRSGRIWLIECVERVDNDCQPFESVASVVKRTIQEERYDALIAQRTEQMEAEYDAERLYRYTAEQLGA